MPEAVLCHFPGPPPGYNETPDWRAETGMVEDPLKDTYLEC